MAYDDLGGRLYAVYGPKVNIKFDANGGCFQFNPDLTNPRLLFSTAEPFSNGHIVEIIGEPINFDDMKYLTGWATTPDANEPDVIDSETDVSDLTHIYAIWKDDSYYIAKGEDQTWEKGRGKGLNVTVKRTGNDEMPGGCFRAIKIDGTQIFANSFNRKDNPLTLTLLPEYLETLGLGEHIIKLEFTADAFVETKFTIVKPDEETTYNNQTDNEHNNSDSSIPNTGDINIYLWIVALAFSAMGIIGTTLILITKKEKIHRLFKPFVKSIYL